MNYFRKLRNRKRNDSNSRRKLDSEKELKLKQDIYPVFLYFLPLKNMYEIELFTIKQKK